MSPRTAQRPSWRHPRDARPTLAASQTASTVERAALTPASHRRLRADSASGMASRLADAWAPMLGLTSAAPDETADGPADGPGEPGGLLAPAEHGDALAP